jgi:prolyl-tRNA editing enzyme YbaK/EbsC (Cys-tRNA(Pro) deacylase)
MHTRAGKLFSEKGFWCKEIPQDEDRGENICKTIMFKRRDGEKVAVLIPLQDRVSYKKMKDYFKQDVSPLSVDELRAEGFEPHECAPMLVTCTLIVDPACTDLHHIRTGSGTLGYGIEWHFHDLAKVRDYVILDVRQ